MGVLVRHWLRVEPSEDIDELCRQYGEAQWLEERFTASVQAGVAKAFGAK